MQAVALELNLDEQALGLVKTRPPDAGFFTLAAGLGQGSGARGAAGAARPRGRPPAPGRGYFGR